MKPKIAFAGIGMEKSMDNKITTIKPKFAPNKRDPGMSILC